MIGRIRSQLPGRLRAARTDESGTTALEFALVAPLFFALLFSFYDVGMLMLREAMLSHAVEKTIRDLRITGDVTVDEFIEDVCTRSFVVADCENSMVIDLTPVGDRGVNLPSDNAPCQDANTPVLSPHMRYSPMEQGEIMFMRVCVTSAPLVTANFMGYNFAKLLAAGSEDGKARIVVATAFMEE